LPTVAIEACAAGRPVVGFDAGGLRDIITDHISGRLIAPGDERGFADALIDLIADPDRRTALGRQALLRAPSFTVDSHVGQLLRCYAELTTPPGAIPAGQSLSADEGDLHERTAHA
jgi:glycosyltransferase involved in cell wall biosynthesis